MNDKKIAYVVLASIMILMMVVSSMTFLQPASAQSSGNPITSATVNGLLNTDNYTLYPYSNNNLTFGFSQYGEMIDPATNTGLAYNGLDAFANPVIAQNEWSEGWLINITYSYNDVYHNVWAFALYSNPATGTFGGNWQWVPSNVSPLGTGGRVYGGYEFNITSGILSPIGYVTTAPITVLYNGPRSYVALCNTTIYEDPAHPLVGVLLTYIFDKVNKAVVVEKDVKLLDTRKFALPFLHVEFGDRGEWDMGTVIRPESYAHLFGPYDNSYAYGYQPFFGSVPANYDVFQMVPVNTTSTPNVGFEAFWPTPMSAYVEGTPYIGTTQVSSLSTLTASWNLTASQTAFTLPNGGATEYPASNGVWSNVPMVFVNGYLQALGTAYTWSNPTVTFNNPVSAGSTVWIIYNHARIQGDMSAEPVNSPYVIGEWAFDLSWSNVTASTNQFEGVTVYGQTDYNNAVDNYGSSNLDSEVKYQLAQVFTPFDLQQAVEKQTDRWVEYSTNPIGSTTFTTSSANLPVWVVPTDDWNQYAQFSERVEDLSTGTVLNRANGDYSFIANNDGTATFYGLIATHYYKFLYSTYPYYESDSSIDQLAFFTTEANDTTNDSPTHTFSGPVGNSWSDPTGMQHFVTASSYDSDYLDFSFTNMSTTSFTDNYTWVFDTPYQEFNVQPFVLYKEDTIGLSTSNNGTIISTVGDGSTLPFMQFNLSQVYLDWYINHAYSEFQNFYDAHFYELSGSWRVEITVSYNTVTTLYTVTINLQFQSGGDQPIYAYQLPGRYEEGVVGTNAASVDSAGLSLVSAAFKDKEVEYGIAAGDTFAGNSTSQIPNQMPYVMSLTSQGTSWSNYYYTDGSFRTGLRDDWCTTWPVSSANMIAVGGPLANMVAYYGNDFATAFYGLPQFTSYAPWENAIVPLTCYSAPTKGYRDTNTTGYGVISTYMDLNGTVQLLIWGNWGRDTYYLSQWFQQEGIFELQKAPDGLTSIVVQINYKNTVDGYKPTGYSVVECLGTISETLWTGTNTYGTAFVKGGWHPDP